MVEVGVIAENERIELVKGELVVMEAKGYAHELLKNALLKELVIAAPKELQVGAETSVEFSPELLLGPDIVLFARHGIRKSNTGYIRLERGSCLLIIEVAQSSLGYDRGQKAALYAQFGAREFWVVDANARVTWVHSGPSDAGWSSITQRGANEVLAIAALPGLSIKLDELD